jgi:hypothetical protein
MIIFHSLSILSVVAWVSSLPELFCGLSATQGKSECKGRHYFVRKRNSKDFCHSLSAILPLSLTYIGNDEVRPCVGSGMKDQTSQRIPVST